MQSKLDRLIVGILSAGTVAMVLLMVVSAGSPGPCCASVGTSDSVVGGEYFGDKAVVAIGDNSGTMRGLSTTGAPQPVALAVVAEPVTIDTERGRFELPLPLRADRFSKPAHSTTLPPLPVEAGVYARVG